MQLFQAKPIPILMYHQCSPTIFQQQLSWLIDPSRGYVPITLHERIKYFENLVSEPFNETDIILTFDDAFQSFFNDIYPILKRLHISATICVPTNFISSEPNTRCSWNGSPTMTWEELRILKDDGFEIIPHSLSHVSFNAIENDKTKLRNEIIGSRDVLAEKLGDEPAAFFCFPYGAGWGKTIVEEVLAEERLSALRAEYKGEGWNRFRIPRWNISCQPSFADLFEAVSGYSC